MGQHADDALNEALDYDIDDVCFVCGELYRGCMCDVDGVWDAIDNEDAP